MSRLISMLSRSSVRLLALCIVGFGGVALGDQILETLDASLTDYKVGKTRVQDASPKVTQRGVNLDGSLRAGSTFKMAIAGNPFENVWRGEQALNGVRLDTGSYHPTDVDLSLPAPGFRWNIGRTYNARQDSGGQYDSDGYQGRNWFQTSQPEILLYDDAQSAADDILYLVYGADRFAEFQRDNESSDEFKGKNGAAGVFQYSAGAGGEPDLYTYTDQVGTEFTFFGFNTASNKADGQIWKIEDPAGNVAYVGDSSTASTAVTNGFDSGGQIAYAYDSADRRFTYTYNADSTPHLTSVVAETKTGGTWASPTGVTEVGKVEYEYYGTESYGDDGDLKLVKTTTPLTDSGVSSVQRKYYRYWEGTFNATTNPGHVHALKLVLDFEGARSFDWDEDSAVDEGFKTASHESLEPYALAYFEYDSSHRIDETWFNGECGCSGSTTGTHLLEYETNGSYTDNSGYDTTWARRTIVQRPDSSYMTQVFDEVGQSLHRIITDADPDNTSPAPEKWVTNVTRNSDGQVTEIGWPDSIASYTHSTGAITTNSSAGLIRTYTRASSGDMKGFMTDRKYKEGSSGSAYFELTLALGSFTKTVGDVTVTRPLVSSQRVYSEAITSGTSGSYLTSFTNTAYSSPDTLSLEQRTTTHPAVDTGKNGSGSSEAAKVHYVEDGTVDFELAEDGIVTYRAYTNGQLTSVIRDADTTSLSPPTGFSSSGTELDHQTTYAYDAQGRLDTTTLPSGRVAKSYYSKIGDDRLVTLQYPKYVSGSGTFYGPVSYTVSNHARKPEVEGTIELSGNSSTAALTAHIDESDSDPITAVDTGSTFGSLATMTTMIYDDSGTKLEKQRVYFTVPASGAGTAVANFDPTVFGYDDSGRRTRVKEAHGTIYRTGYDLRGQVTARWIGTNDSSFAGGEASGTDNMVQTEAMVYDSGADDGNGYLTTGTLYVVDGTTDKRDTTYEHDVRGNVLLETRPASPHAFNKYDNMNRLIASGGFSSTGSIVVGTDDPTTETANRLTLSQTFFDEMGRVWKSQRHKIDDSDGSDDDNLQRLTWFDATGQVTKVDGEELSKALYDRLGRVTHHFTLATDNDSAYADADDVTGDIVLLERQTTYEADSSNVLMEATISRFHDDYGGGETTGALDTNADGDELMYTAANLEGRIQISSMWYDATDRLADRVEYGTYGGSNFDRDSLAVPTRSDTALRTTYTYNDDGSLLEIEDPKGLKQRFEYDDAGQRTKVTANYTDGTPGGGTDDEDDQVVEYAFSDGLQTTITAKMPSSSDDQVTTYSCGTAGGGAAGDSDIATGHLLHTVQYPDSSGGSDVVTFAYNAQGELIYKKDQAGNVIETDYDTQGRKTDRRVTTLAGGFDGAVRRISTTYTNRGEVQLVTQYDAATSGSVVDEVQYTYDDWGMVGTFEQDRNSAVGATGSVDDYEVSYTYAKAGTGGRNTIKRTGVTLPDGSSFVFSCSAADSRHDSDASRVTFIIESETTLVAYDYNGVGELVGTTYDVPDVMWRMYGSSGSYPDLDRFNRVTSSRWTKDLATDVDFYDVDLEYDRNSNITSAVDNVHTGFDVIYTMDELNRLKQAEEGTKSGSSITSKTRDEQWVLSQTGNWERDKLDLNGDGDYLDTSELDEAATYNKANEQTARDIDNDSTPDYSPTYDAVGNLTDDQELYEYEYDAFGRLRTVKNTTTLNLKSEFKYNGLGYRISTHQDTDTDGDVDADDKWFHFAYDEGWRMVGTFREDDTDPKEVFVHNNAGAGGFGGSSYIDSVAFRDKDADTAWTTASDGTLEERVYYCQNWRSDVSAIVTNGGAMKEWAKYSAYGVPQGLPLGDTDSDGDRDATDATQIQTWIDAPAYDVRGDADLDGDVDSTDKSTIQASTVTMGRGALSGNGNRRGFAAYEYDAKFRGKYHVRNRVLDSYLGRWQTRDSLEYVDNMNLSSYGGLSPMVFLDPTGAKLCEKEWEKEIFLNFIAWSVASITLHCKWEWTSDCLNDCGPKPQSATCYIEGLFGDTSGTAIAGSLGPLKVSSGIVNRIHLHDHSYTLWQACDDGGRDCNLRMHVLYYFSKLGYTYGHKWVDELISCDCVECGDPQEGGDPQE